MEVNCRIGAQLVRTADGQREIDINPISLHHSYFSYITKKTVKVEINVANFLINLEFILALPKMRY